MELGITTSSQLTRLGKQMGFRIYVVGKHQLAHRTPIQNEMIIVNIDDGSKGTHWVAIFSRGKRYLYFDSFALAPPTNIAAYIKRVNGNKKIPYNNSKLQDPRAESCGYWCVLRLDYMRKRSILTKWSLTRIHNILTSLFNNVEQNEIILHKLYSGVF